MLLFYIIFIVKSSYYIVFGSGLEKYKCDTRDDLIDRINSMDLSFQRLPTITIDEDLELDCNELPMFYYNVATLHRGNTFPTYTFNSNKTDGFATFTLDTSTSSEDNCPGFTFSDISIVFKGTSLNTSKISISDNVKITTEPGFELHTTISEMPLNVLTEFPNLSFCRLSIYPETSATEENFAYPDEIELHLELKYAESYMFSIDITDTTDVLFDNGQMAVTISNKTSLAVRLPPIINYSNAFYFNVLSSDISFTISGFINFTDHFPHYTYIVQDVYNAQNIKVTLNDGNYFTSPGTLFKTVTGVGMEVAFAAADVVWNTTQVVEHVSLSYANLFVEEEMRIESPFAGTSFSFYGGGKIEGDLNVTCDTVRVTDGVECENCSLEITAGETGDMVDFNGTLTVTSSITHEVSVDTIVLKGHPTISLLSRPPIRARRVVGGASIIPSTVGAVGTVREVLCVEDQTTINESDFTVVSDYVDAFVSVVVDGCVCVNKTKSYTKSPTFSISGDDNEWKERYEPFMTSLTFTASSSTCTLDLTVLAGRKLPVSLSIQASVPCSLVILIDQDSADTIDSVTFGASGTELNVTWSEDVSLSCRTLTVHPCCPVEMVLDGLNVSLVGCVNLRDFSQLQSVAEFAPGIKTIAVNSATKVKNFTFTSTGWRVHTDGMSDDEYLEIEGFTHPSILVTITNRNVFNKQMYLGIETDSPFSLYISYDTSLTVYLVGGDFWDRTPIQPIIVVSGTLTLEMQSELLPVNFDDRLFDDVIGRSGSRQLAVNRTANRAQSIISVTSPFNLMYSVEVTALSSSLYFEVANEAVLQGSATVVHGDDVLVVFRDRLVMDGSNVQRMWRESSTVLLKNRASLTSPSFLDDVVIEWDCCGVTPTKPSTIQGANLFTFEFADASLCEVTNETERFFSQPFFVASAAIDVSCEELISRVTFADGRMSFNFSNRVVSFDIFCADLIYTTHPATFSQLGYDGSQFPSHIGLFLNRTTNDEQLVTDRGGGKKDLDPGVIACIAIGACVVIVIVVALSVYLFRRKRHGIENLVKE